MPGLFCLAAKLDRRHAALITLELASVLMLCLWPVTPTCSGMMKALGGGSKKSAGAAAPAAPAAAAENAAANGEAAAAAGDNAAAPMESA